MILSLIRQHPRLALALAAVLMLVAGGAVAGVVFLSRAYAAPPQPLPYQHSKHLAAGATCLYCHPGADSGAVAGLPSLAKCMGCHVAVVPQDPKDQPNIDKLIQQWESGQPIQWIKINDQPDFVQFNHRPHVAAGVACESCHGDVSQMGTPHAYNLNMGFCLDCHRRQSPDKMTRLIDCATCHY
jgi:hypothetical protein